MSRTYRKTTHGQYSRTHRRHISVRAIRRTDPDFRTLSRAAIAQALAEADAERKAQQTTGQPPEPDEV